MKKLSYDPLWRKLATERISKTELAEKSGVGRGSLTRMAKDEPVGLDIILKICNFLDCDIYDVVEIR